MGKSNAAIRTYIGKVERFADLFNYYLFAGVAIIKAEDLEPTDGESDIIVENKDGKGKEVQRYRDITMRWKNGADLTILACENQERVHYAMPVRTMLYDSLSYADQIKRIGENLKEKKLLPEEFLSKFQKDDKLIPVITIIFYYGLEEWDASTDLYGMLEVNDYLKESDVFQNFVPNYKINLIDVEHMKNLEKLQTDLQIVLGMLQYRGNTEKLKGYVEEYREYFGSVDKDTYNAIAELLQSKSKLKNALKPIRTKNGEERVDVCKAIDGIYDNGVNAGKKMMRDKLKEAEYKAKEAEYKAKEAEDKMRKAANRLLNKMEVSEVAEVLGVEIDIIKSWI